MARPGRDIEQDVEISLEEAYHGTNRAYRVEGRRLDVKIPPGVKTGSRVRMAGKGGPGQGGGPPGNLYLRVKVLPHNQFERDGDNLSCAVPVPPLGTVGFVGPVLVISIVGSVPGSIVLAN